MHVSCSFLWVTTLKACHAWTNISSWCSCLPCAAAAAVAIAAIVAVVWLLLLLLLYKYREAYQIILQIISAVCLSPVGSDFHRYLSVECLNLSVTYLVCSIGNFLLLRRFTTDYTTTDKLPTNADMQQTHYRQATDMQPISGMYLALFCISLF